MKILGLETSCDETAAAVVTDSREILSNIVLSQVAEHAPYGGVVPEIASRAHISHIENVISQALSTAKTTLDDIDGIAVTAGPGLIGGVIVGLMAAKGIAAAAKKPLLAVNHLEGHALTARLTNNIEFPFLLLLVSGGHCQILVVEGVGKYRKLGATLDDAVGEAFDKTAKMLGLGYPGGPAVEKMALKGNPERFDLPTPLKGKEGCDFSLSGLKTAVYRIVEAEKNKDEKFIADMCASFQKVCGEIISDRIGNAIQIFKDSVFGIQDSEKTNRSTLNSQFSTLVVAGGVAANKYLGGILESAATENSMRFIAPPLKLCTDNAAMIAWVGVEKMKLGLIDGLNFEPKARWPLF